MELSSDRENNIDLPKAPNCTQLQAEASRRLTVLRENAFHLSQIFLMLIRKWASATKGAEHSNATIVPNPTPSIG